MKKRGTNVRCEVEDRSWLPSTTSCSSCSCSSTSGMLFLRVSRFLLARPSCSWRRCGRGKALRRRQHSESLQHRRCEGIQSRLRSSRSTSCCCWCFSRVSSSVHSPCCRKSASPCSSLLKQKWQPSPSRRMLRQELERVYVLPFVVRVKVARVVDAFVVLRRDLGR